MQRKLIVQLHSQIYRVKEELQMTNDELCSNIEQLPLVLRVNDLMPVLKIGRNTAYDLIRSGQLKAIRVGNSYRVSRSELLRFLGEAA